jgi:hypothetical protein
VKRLLTIVGIMAAMLLPHAAQAQRSMRLGGAAPSAGAAPVRGMVAPGVGNFRGNFGGVHGGFVPINPGFVGTGGVRFRGAIGFGHNPRFFVGFGNRFGRFGHGCFGDPFCRGFGGFGSTFIVPQVVYPYPYYAPAYYDQPAAESAYTVVQGDRGYQQGASAQQVQQLMDEVERLRSEMQERDREVARANQPPSRGYTTPTVQELPLATTLVFRGGRQMEIRNYAIVGSTIWIFNEQAAKKVPLTQLDLEATKRVNADKGILFVLPGMK